MLWLRWPRAEASRSASPERVTAIHDLNGIGCGLRRFTRILACQSGFSVQTPWPAVIFSPRAGWEIAATENITVLFTDLVGSTELASALSPEAGDEVRRKHFSALRQAIVASGGTEVLGLGDINRVGGGKNGRIPTWTIVDVVIVDTAVCGSSDERSASRYDTVR